MQFKTNCHAEFLGGPLDGFIRTISGNDRRSEYVIVPINIQILQLTASQQADSEQPVTSVAVYRLLTRDTDGGAEYCYQFLKAVSPIEC